MRLLQDAVDIPVPILVDRHVAAGSANVDGRTVAGVGRIGLIVTDGGYRDTLGIGCRILRGGGPGVARRADDGDALIVSVDHGVLQGGRAGSAAKTHVYHLGPVIGRVGDTVDNSGVGTVSGGVENLYRHDAAVEGDASDAEVVVGGLRDRAGHVRAVGAVIIRMAVVVDKVVSGDKRGAGQIRRLRVGPVGFVGHAAVDDRYDHTGCTGRLIPGGRHIDKGHVPLVHIVGIVRGHECMGNIVRLRVFHVGPSAKGRNHLFYGLVGRDGELADSDGFVG